MKATPIWKNSQDKLKRSNQQQQNLWTIGSVLFAAVVYLFPAPAVLGEVGSQALLIFALALAAVCVVGSATFVLQNSTSSAMAPAARLNQGASAERRYVLFINYS